MIINKIVSSFGTLMYIISSLFTNNARIPIILSENRIPYLLPLLFTITNLKNKSDRTKIQYIDTIKSFYAFFHENDINIEKYLITGDFTHVIIKIESYILGNSKINCPYNIEIIHKFLKWCMNRYSKDSDTIKIIDNIIGLHKRSESKAVKNEYRSLTIPDVLLIREIIDIKSPNNPFNKDVRLRNWIIIELLLQCGIRLGELLKLKVNDFIRIEDRFYIKIRNYKGDKEDSRKIEPSNKNNYSFRTISITPQLFEIIHSFICKERRLRKKLNHSYLLVSVLGSPLTIRAAQVPFSTINTSLAFKNETISVPLSAHVLRHTFADNFLSFLIEEWKMDMERAKDELRSICGWSASSLMPLRYANRFIRSKANEHNMERVKLIYSNNL